MSGDAVLSLLRPVSRLIERKMSLMLRFLDRHYTPLAVLVLVTMGGTVILITSYLFRYKYWNYWLWKSRAVTKTVYLGAALVTLKIILGVR